MPAMALASGSMAWKAEVRLPALVWPFAETLGCPPRVAGSLLLGATTTGLGRRLLVASETRGLFFQQIVWQTALSPVCHHECTDYVVFPTCPDL